MCVEITSNIYQQRAARFIFFNKIVFYSMFDSFLTKQCLCVDLHCCYHSLQYIQVLICLFSSIFFTLFEYHNFTVLCTITCCRYRPSSSLVPVFLLMFISLCNRVISHHREFPYNHVVVTVLNSLTVGKVCCFQQSRLMCC